MTEPIEIIETIIANAMLTASDFTNQAADAADDLLGVNAGFYIAPPASTTGFTVSAVEPDVPTVEDSVLNYEQYLDKLVALLSGQLAGFFAQYYPLVSDAFDEATAWLVSTITNGGTGINQAIWDQVWNRARENVIADGRRVQAQIVTGFSAKGIMLPAGVMTRKISESLFDQTGKTGIVATSNAMKQVEIQIETIKFAVEKALESRTMAMTAATDYIRAIATSPAAAAQVASLNSDNRAKMLSAAGEFYRARLSRDELVLRSKLAELDSTVDVYKHRRDNATQNDQVEVQALAAAADVFGRTASAAIASLNSIVSTASNSFA